MINSDIKNTNDSELIMLYHEEDEIAKDILYMKYKFIIDLLIRKYNNILKNLNVDYQEIYSECSVGFSDGLASYKEDREASLPTFITVCIERRIKGIIRKYSQAKYKAIADNYSLYFKFADGSELIDVLSDNFQNDPLKNITDNENYQELVLKIKKLLTKNEWDVFILMAKNFNYQEIAKILNKKPKQIDNAMQRVKIKIRRILKEIEQENEAVDN